VEEVVRGVRRKEEEVVGVRKGWLEGRGDNLIW
jgi:hypothetical protein